MKPVLVVCNEPGRTFRIRQWYADQGAKTAWYPHYDAYLLDLAERRPPVMVVDLLLPIDPKLNLIAKAREQYADLPLVLVGKSEYLAAQNLFQNDAHVTLIDDIDQLPPPPKE